MLNEFVERYTSVAQMKQSVLLLIHFDATLFYKRALLSSEALGTEKINLWAPAMRTKALSSGEAAPPGKTLLPCTSCPGALSLHPLRTKFP